MKLGNQLVLLASVTASSLASPPIRAAVYTMSDVPTGNYILAHNVLSDGTLSAGKATYAGGLGYVPLTTPNGHFRNLFGAGSIIVHDDLLFAVNPGSNTFAMFSINPHDPTQLTMIGNPVDSGGDFPNSIDISPATGNACVLNQGQRNGVQCYTVDRLRGLKVIPNTLRTTNLGQTNPPIGPDNTTSHILFSPNGSRITIATKGDKVAQRPGYLASWIVNHDGTLSEDYTKVTPPTGGFDPFGMTLIPGYDVFLSTDPGPKENGPGLIIYDYRKGLNATTWTSLIPGQMDSCWAEFSPRTKNVYTSDRLTNQVSELRMEKNLTATIVNQYQLPVLSGLLDIGIVSIPDLKNDYFYVIASNGTRVETFRLNGPGNATHVQSFNESAFGVPVQGSNIGGMATYPKPITQT